MSLTRMRMKQIVRSESRLYLCHDGKDFAELPRTDRFGIECATQGGGVTLRATSWWLG